MKGVFIPYPGEFPEKHAALSDEESEDYLVKEGWKAYLVDRFERDLWLLLADKIWTSGYGQR